MVVSSGASHEMKTTSPFFELQTVKTVKVRETARGARARLGLGARSLVPWMIVPYQRLYLFNFKRNGMLDAWLQ